MPKTPGVKAEILIGGQRFSVGDITVVAYDEPGAYSFYSIDTKSGMPCFGPRYEKPGKPVTTIEQLFGFVHQLIIHTDLTRDSKGCFNALVGRDLSTHFMIEWDGTCYQPLDLLDCGYHAGESNSGGIGLDMNNMMKNLEKAENANAPPYDPDHERYAEMSKKKYNRPRSDRMEINGAKVRSWGYTDPQYNALIQVLKELTNRFTNLKAQYPVDAKGDVVGRVLDDFQGFNGFMAHWHVEAQRWDPGPGFDWQRVFHALGNEFNAFPIEFQTDVNIKSLLEPQKVREYAETYYKNNETQTAGWYPMGINQTWHGGIHLAAPEDKATPVLAMTDGVLVAARFGKQKTKLGNNNFILLKHTVNIPAKKKDLEGKKFIFYSLYMHLDYIDVSKLDESSPDWLRDMYRIDSGKGEEEEEKAEEEKEEKDKKPEPDAAAEEEVEVEEVDPDKIDTRAWLDVGNHLAALKRGDIAKIAYAENPVKVKSGSRLADVGVFGNNPGEWKRQVHIEVFADSGWKDAIDVGVHGRYLTELDDDVSSDLYVENNDILGLFGVPKRVPGLNPKRVIPQSDIEYFWAADGEFVEEKRYLRKAVVRHVSEWSDKVDWVTSLSKAESWDEKVADFKKILKGSPLGKDAIETVLPFIWLSKDMAEHIGIDVKEWRGLLDHFHPIHFLMWLTYNSAQRVQVISSGISKKQAEKKAREEQARMEEARKSQPLVEAEDDEYSIVDFLDETGVEDAGTILEPWMNGRDQGEWKRPAPEEE